MAELLALLFVSFPQPTPPIYRYGHCYQASDATYRPSIIGIHQVGSTYYKYRIWRGFDQGWTSDLYGKIYTIEYVYSQEIKCP